MFFEFGIHFCTVLVLHLPLKYTFVWMFFWRAFFDMLHFVWILAVWRLTGSAPSQADWRLLVPCRVYFFVFLQETPPQEADVMARKWLPPHTHTHTLRAWIWKGSWEGGCNELLDHYPQTAPPASPDSHFVQSVWDQIRFYKNVWFEWNAAARSILQPPFSHSDI